MENRFFRHILTGVLLFGIILLSFWIRIQGTAELPAGQFTEHDAYLYHWQAGIIAEQGHLPERDMHRWLPIGRDNRQLLPLYSYAIAYLHKVFPGWSLYQIQLYLPPVCFAIGLSVIFLFLNRSYGLLFATFVSLLLTTLPGSIERSAASFGDRDAWCWMAAALAVTSYLWKEQVEPGWRRHLVTALSGVTVFLGGLSWEAFGVFLLIIHAVELWKFCNTDTEAHLFDYLLWMFMFIPWLFLMSPAYRNGYGFSTHVAALMLAPPLVIFTLRSLRYLLIRFCQSIRLYAQRLACALTLLTLVIGIGFFFLQFNTFEITAFALRESKLMKSIGELKDPQTGYWINRYGAIFLFGSIGVMLTSLRLWKSKSLPLVGSVTLFVCTTFFRDFVSRWTSSETCDTLFFISLGLTLLSLAGITFLQKETNKNELITLAMLAWFLLWVGLSRGGKRYDFFIGVPLAFFTTTFIEIITNYLFSATEEEKIEKKQHISTGLRKTIAACLILLSFMFLPPLGAYATRAIYAATQMRKPTPGNVEITKAFHWIKTQLPPSSVIAAKWDYGTQLNVFSRVKTITDPDIYIPNWINLYAQYVERAKSERACLEFLKTHSATHLMLTRKDFAIPSFLNGKSAEVFLPAYPAENFSKAPVNIWEIRYPLDIKSDPKYLATQQKGDPLGSEGNVEIPMAYHPPGGDAKLNALQNALRHIRFLRMHRLY